MERPVSMVIEDDADIALLISTTLTRSGTRVVEAQRAREALTLVDQLDPALITVDLGLPDLDGLELIRRLRSHSDGHILVVSARARPGDLTAATDAGADDYLVKPFSPRDLRERVAAVLERATRLVTVG